MLAANEETTIGIQHNKVAHRILNSGFLASGTSPDTLRAIWGAIDAVRGKWERLNLN